MALATALPFTVVHNSLLVPARLNGRPATLMVDTGWELSSILRSRRQKFGLHPIGVEARVSGIGGERRLDALEAQSFALGTLHGRDLFLTMIDEPKLDDLADGVLGSDYLSGYDIDFDFPARELRLYKVIEGCRSPSAPLDGPLYTAPLTLSSDPEDRGAYLTVTLNGRTIRAEIDSGAEGSVMFAGAARRVGLTSEVLAADPQSESFGVGPRAVPTARHVMAPITIGEVTIAHLPVGVMKGRMPDGTEMLLGMDFLTHVHVYLSYSSKTLIMQYPPKASPPLPK